VPSNSQAIDALIIEAKRLEEDCRYTRKGHYEAERIWNNAHLILGLISLGFSIGAGQQGLFAENPKIAGLLAGIAAVFTIIYTFISPNDRACQHHSFGAHYTRLRNQARM
jgi:hypothetical protein